MEYLSTLKKDDPSVAIRSVHNLNFTFPIQYYDFHVYYYAHYPPSKSEAEELIDKLLKDFPEDTSSGSIIVKKLPNDNVIGPHPTQFWEADVSRPEVFVKLLSWFQLHHGNLLVLIHPQTGEEKKDHTSRALWLGKSLPILVDILDEDLGGVPEFGVRRGQRVDPKKFREHKTILQ